MALPICTAWENSSAWVSVNSAEEKVAPWIPSRPVRPPMSDDRVAGFGFFCDLVARDQADASAEHQRIAEISIVEIDCAVDGGDAHAVPVIAHAGDDLLEDALGVDDALGERVQGSGFRVQGRAWISFRTLNPEP